MGESSVSCATTIAPKSYFCKLLIIWNGMKLIGSYDWNLNVCDFFLKHFSFNSKQMLINGRQENL